MHDLSAHRRNIRIHGPRNQFVREAEAAARRYQDGLALGIFQYSVDLTRTEIRQAYQRRPVDARA
jgi:hypothetical protein